MLKTFLLLSDSLGYPTNQNKNDYLSSRPVKLNRITFVFTQFTQQL